ncbi:MAG: RNA-binding transcriptional accessory protein [Gammaproteobacteria bacterium]|nr:RNA-binding transcriptional accessory protein [Gammaproteobacteria bacterium]
MDIIGRIAAELNVKPKQVEAAVELLDGGATVPFIARYRKEVTSAESGGAGLDDSQLRTLEDRLKYLRELEERRAVILKSISEQEKLTPELGQAIEAADNKTRLEDLYLPYKPKRRTKAQIAKEAGLEPLALALWEDAALIPQELAATYIDLEKGIPDAKAALEGARQILMERFAEDAELLGQLRDYLWKNALIKSHVVSGKEIDGQKFSDYYDFSEAINKIPSHRILAILRGRREGILTINIEVATPAEQVFNPCERLIALQTSISDIARATHAADPWLQETVRWTWKIKLQPQLELELINIIRETAETEAIRVFGLNLRDLLLASPAGRHVTMGLDPGLRTGVKVAIVDDTGKMLGHSVIYPHVPQKQWDAALKTLTALCQKHKVTLISIGNGTASRETDQLATTLIKNNPELKMTKLVVSEAGASVYSASELASNEFPDIDVTIRGAISIARRLQDPLAELVKIEPKSIGVGQYQHDVNQTNLGQHLDTIVEDCVNAVGVDLNTASVPLLARVSGLNETVARNIVEFRDAHGAFKNRRQLKEVPRLGDKTFEQAAGFLRISNGDNPLDASSVHPEAYPVVERIIATAQRDIKAIIGDSNFLKSIKASDYVDEVFGIPTIVDIIAELDKPGRDPRPEFKTAQFQEGVETLADLKPGMVLEGVVTNVTNFGAFVDIGVHQDGLIHISELAHKFVQDPRSVVKAGGIVKVKVMEVDISRKRISLSMKLEDAPPVKANSDRAQEKTHQGSRPAHQADANRRSGTRPSSPPPAKKAPKTEGESIMGNAFADALAKLKERV